MHKYHVITQRKKWPYLTAQQTKKLEDRTDRAWFSRHFTSIANKLLVQRSCTASFGLRSFDSSGPTAWNDMPAICATWTYL